MNFICLNCGMNVKKFIEEDATFHFVIHDSHDQLNS